MRNILGVEDGCDDAAPARSRAELRHLPIQRKTGDPTDTGSANASTSPVSAPEVPAGPDITEFLLRAARGDAAAVDSLIPKIYASLRGLAHRQRAREAAHTLETTALVHEAYLTLARQGGFDFVDSAHFFAYMSRVMRHILIDRARRKQAHKRQAVEVTAGVEESEIVDVLALDEALNRLAALDARLARVAELRLFAELTSAEIGSVTGVNARTVERDWLKARTFLAACLTPQA